MQNKNREQLNSPDMAFSKTGPQNMQTPQTTPRSSPFPHTKKSSASEKPRRKLFFLSKKQKENFSKEENAVHETRLIQLLPNLSDFSNQFDTNATKPDQGSQHQHVVFRSNSISTAKYTLFTFPVKFIYEQFRNYGNVFFLLTSLLQQIPGITPTNRFDTIMPLMLVLFVAALKEVTEDVRRHKSDDGVNMRFAEVLNTARVSLTMNGRRASVEPAHFNGGLTLSSPTATPIPPMPPEWLFEKRRWKDVVVGDVVCVTKDEFFPADVVLLSSSDADGMCYVDTCNLDGETNLKLRSCLEETRNLPLDHLSNGTLECEAPNSSLYTFEGTLNLELNGTTKSLSLGPNQLLLRGASLRNTAWVIGVVVFTGHETKLLRNASAAPIKRTRVQHVTNMQILALAMIVVALSILCTWATMLLPIADTKAYWYLSSLTGNQALISNNSTPASTYAITFFSNIATFWVLFSNFVPISLIVTLETARFFNASLISQDLKIADPDTGSPAVVRTSSLVEELGQVEFMFTDKTGTLTCNVMHFVECCIGGVRYLAPRNKIAARLSVGKDGKSDDLAKSSKEHNGNSNVTLYNSPTQRSSRSIPVVDSREYVDSSHERITTLAQSNNNMGQHRVNTTNLLLSASEQPHSTENSSIPETLQIEVKTFDTILPLYDDKNTRKAENGLFDNVEDRLDASNFSATEDDATAAGRRSGIGSQDSFVQQNPHGPYELRQQLNEYLSNEDQASSHAEYCAEFMMLLASCHSVVPEKSNNNEIAYQASSPDEAALVAGASDIGYQFYERRSGSITIRFEKLFQSIGSAEYLKSSQKLANKLEVLALNEFNSTRKRMSVLVCQDGNYKLFVKGADSMIFPLLAKDPERNPPAIFQKTLAAIDSYATKGLRTLTLASRDLTKEDALNWLEMYNAAATALSDRSDKLDAAAAEIETELRLLGATAVEDKLQNGVPDTIATLSAANIKIWVLTGDRTETAINVGFSCSLLTNDTKLHVITGEEIMEQEAKKSARNQTNTGGSRETLGASSPMLKAHVKAVAIHRLGQLYAALSKLSPESPDIEQFSANDNSGQFFSSNPKPAFMNPLSTPVNRPFNKTQRQELPSRNSMLTLWTTSSASTSSLNSARSRLTRPRWLQDMGKLFQWFGKPKKQAKGEFSESDLTALADYHQEVSSETIESEVTIMQNNCKRHALVVDGVVLQAVIDEPIFVKTACLMGSVVCCRVSPLQKAQVVRAVRAYTKQITLAIGDGANDVSMIQAASIGVGITGQEGTQAARSADVAIARFRFLQRLLLVHGCYAYSRLTKLTLFSFYKNTALYVTQLWFTIFNAFSGQTFYESWLLSLFNVIFTSTPPLAIGIFDRVLSAKALIQNPGVYIVHQSGRKFNVRVFWSWIANSVFHGALLFFGYIAIYGPTVANGSARGGSKSSQATLGVEDGVFPSTLQGKVPGLWPLGAGLYTALLFTVLGKASLLISSWVFPYTFLSIGLSVVSWFVFFPLYSWIAGVQGSPVPELAGAYMIYLDSRFWLSLLLLPFSALLRDFVIKFERGQHNPTALRLMQMREHARRQEAKLQRHADTTPRPALSDEEKEQNYASSLFLRLKHRFRSGFAFSQSPDQRKIIFGDKQ